jgi:hypothetical protein
MSYLTHAAEEMAHHRCAEGTVGSVAMACCQNCGCAYSYCDACQSADEREHPETGCRDTGCGCHTDSRHELA